MRDELDTTPAPLDLPAQIVNIEARLADEVFTDGEVFTLDLEGQEFLRFRGLWNTEHAETLAAEFGLLQIGAQPAFERLAYPADGDWWTSLLRNDPTTYLTETVEGEGIVESVEDWIALSGMLDFAVGLLALLQEPERIDSLRTALNDLQGGTRPRDAEDPIRSDYEQEASWVVSILGGAARMGCGSELVSDGVSFDWIGHGHPIPDSPAWSQGPDQFLDFDFTVESVAVRLSDLLNPWLASYAPALRVEAGRLVASQRPPRDLLSILWLQLVNALARNLPLRVCAWKRCPGPPARPRMFLWQSGQTASGQKRSTSIYCSPRCARAAAMARAREKGKK